MKRIIMTGINQTKNKLIDLILATKNEELLKVLSSMLSAISSKNNERVSFSSEQIEMLNLSEEDIKNGDFISEDDLDKSDSKWLS